MVFFQLPAGISLFTSVDFFPARIVFLFVYTNGAPIKRTFQSIVHFEAHKTINFSGLEETNEATIMRQTDWRE